jgi:NAD(P)-dependent dehydrogenase (short-subunit alcohol dehydrogenase family)
MIFQDDFSCHGRKGNTVKERVMSEKRVALISGAARGIGLGIAGRLVREGWRVVAADIDVQAGRAAAKGLGAAAGFVAMDVSDETSVAAAVKAVHDEHGRLDGLVNNAGLSDPLSGPLEKLRLAAWNRWLAVNLTGAFLLSKHALPLLRSTGGAIVNIASTRALQSEADTEAYAASKGGLVAFTHALAMSVGPAVRVNCISPGWIDSRPAEDKAPLRAIDHAQHPVGRVGQPADVAALASFLLSAEAGFITGQNWLVDGGMVRKMIYAG